MGQRVTRETQQIMIRKELAKRPILDRKKHFGSKIYSVCGNKMRFFGNHPHTDMNIPERVEYFIQLDDRMTFINCARYADSKPNALR